MKPFALFAGLAYSGGGGWFDLQGEYASADEAVFVGRALVVAGDANWWHVVNLDLRAKVADSVDDHPVARRPPSAHFNPRHAKADYLDDTSS